MPRVIGVSFREAGKIYYFESDETNILPGEAVIVETAQGTEFGEVVLPVENIGEDEVVSPLKPIIRKANEEDCKKREELKELEQEAFYVCQDKIAKHDVDMKLVGVECLFDESRLIFYFSADSRVDFRDLVKDLATTFKKRIEMRQIGVRDEAKIIGGLGSCGRRLCCNTFLKDFEPVSIKLAKEQNLPLNPFKISGVCGRLMCCLRYEYETYKDFNKRAPKRGTCVQTCHGEGRVVDYSPCRDSAVVETESGIRHEVPLSELKNKKPQRQDPEAK